MIQEFVDRFMENKPKLENVFRKKHPDTYIEVVEAVVKILHDNSKYGTIDPKRIHEINDGDYQGTLVYVVGAEGYQPRRYWYVRVDYGSCSGCDTLESIREYSSDKPTEEQVGHYMTLALHIVQGLKEMGGDSV